MNKNISAEYLEIEWFGLTIHPWSMAATLDAIRENIEGPRRSLVHIVVNTAKLVYSQKDEVLRRTLNEADIVNIDGMGVVLGLRLLGHKVPERVAGIDLFTELIELCAENGWRPYFLGAKPAVVKKTVEMFSEQYSDLQIAGYRDGYFSEEEETDVAETIRASGADMLFIAITSPKKEIFLNRFGSEMNVPFSMGVGGSFDIIAGVTKRAPQWMQRCGLEWFYRIMEEPRRMWKRYAVTNTIYAFLLVKELFLRRHYRA